MARLPRVNARILVTQEHRVTSWSHCSGDTSERVTLSMSLPYRQVPVFVAALGLMGATASAAAYGIPRRNIPRWRRPAWPSQSPGLKQRLPCTRNSITDCENGGCDWQPARTRSPHFCAKSSSRFVSRAVATSRSPDSSTASAMFRPKPPALAVTNHTLFVNSRLSSCTYCSDRRSAALNCKGVVPFHVRKAR